MVHWLEVRNNGPDVSKSDRRCEGQTVHAHLLSLLHRMFLLWWQRVLWYCCVWIASLLPRVRRSLLKGVVTSNLVGVGTLVLLLTAVACFSETITAAHAASAASGVAQHGVASPRARLGQRSSPAAGGGQVRWRYHTGRY